MPMLRACWPGRPETGSPRFSKRLCLEYKVEHDRGNTADVDPWPPHTCKHTLHNTWHVIYEDQNSQLSRDRPSSKTAIPSQYNDAICETPLSLGRMELIQSRTQNISGLGLSCQLLDLPIVVLSSESKLCEVALKHQLLSRCDITLLVILMCFLESDHTNRSFPNKTFVSVNRYFTQSLKWRILKPVFVLPANILFQSLQFNKWGRLKWLLEKPMLGCQQLPICCQRVTFTAHLEKQLVLSGEFCTWLQSRWKVSGMCTPLFPLLRWQK